MKKLKILYVTSYNSSYSRDMAVNYATAYYENYNDEYPDWGADCANFISQCLVAGGKNMMGSDSTNNGTAWEKKLVFIW